MNNIPPTNLPYMWGEGKGVSVFPLAHSDWDAIKTRLAKLREPFGLSEALGGTFLGFSLPNWHDFIQLISTGKLPNPWYSSQAWSWAFWCTFASFIFFGIALMEKRHKSEKAEDILYFCENVEARTPQDFDPIEKHKGNLEKVWAWIWARVLEWRAKQPPAKGKDREPPENSG